MVSAEASHRTKGLLRLTMACNERCPFCNVPMEAYPRPTPPEAEVAAELDAFVASGEQTLTISGGEPTLLRKRLLAVIREARARGIPFVELQTNAVLIDAEYARDLAAAGLTSAFVSLLSDVPELHDALAGLEGAFGRCVDGIDALLAEGVRVTLNPVTALATQDRLPSYVDFVAERLPGVRSISVSAVQPHGRAVANAAELLPDYAVLAPAVRGARERAEAHGIELLNPYCGLPLCVGWEDGLDRSVEAIEATLGGWRDTPGIENQGDKRHGGPCRGCALRPRCGGAWHAYWDLRGGSGIRAPIALVRPWVGDPAAGSAVVWHWTRELSLDDVRADVTDVAVDAPADALLADRDTLRALRARPSRLRVHVGIRPGAPGAALRLVELLAAMGVDAVRLLRAGPAWDAAAERIVAAMRDRHPGLDLGIEPAPRELA